MATGQLLE